MKHDDVLKYNIRYQGDVKIKEGTIWYEYEKLALITLSTFNKWGEILFTGSNNKHIPRIGLLLEENGDCTEVEFSTFKGWTIITESWGKNEVFICLIKM